MRRNFYEFGDEPFRDALWSDYIIPVANWFLRDSGSGFLLPQNSGSLWECSLAVLFLMGVAEEQNTTDEMKELIINKCVATIKWIVSQLRVETNGRSWDSTQWDTAVVLRAVLQVRRTQDYLFEKAEIEQIDGSVEDICCWLMDCVKTKKSYLAGPPDYAQVLITLIEVSELYPSKFTSAAKRIGYSNTSNSINEIADILLNSANSTTENATGEEKSFESLTYWVDAFNTGEVLEGLNKYIEWLGKRTDKSPTGEIRSEKTRKAIIEGIRYIETSQTGCTWGGVADTCGTLWCYLVVLKNTTWTQGAEYENQVIFKALRWMCDSNQSMDDGSFLHTAYVTVFYSLAMLEAYLAWPLGQSAANKVYDIALYQSPLNSSEERTRRLYLELELNETKIAITSLKQKHKSDVAFFWSTVVVFAGLITMLSLSIALGVISVTNVSFEINALDTLIGIIGLAIVIVPALVVLVWRIITGSKPQWL